VGVLAGCNGRKERRDAPQTAPAPPRDEPSAIDTPEKLLRKVLALASNKRYDELAEHIVPLRLTPPPGSPTPRATPQDVRAEILEGIRSRKKTGDFAYSSEALLAIVTNHLDRLGPVPAELLESWAAGKGLGRDENLQAAAKAGGKDLLCFRRSGTFILMRKAGERLRLAYWKDLNRILGDAATAAADTRRYHDLEPITAKLKKGGRFVRASISLVIDAEKADVLEKLLRTKKEAVRQWLDAFLAEQDPARLAEKAKRQELQAEIRTGLNRALNLEGRPQIDAVTIRELTVQ
jgi:flagellar basal body-associated protein FliL